MKKYLAVAILLFCFANSRAQTLSFADFGDLVNLTLPQVENILIQTGKFKINDKQEEYGQVVTYFQTMDKDKKPVKGETLIAGGYRNAADGIKLRTVTYQTIYPEYVENLQKQILKFGYKLTFKGQDQIHRMFVYDNNINHITVQFDLDHKSNAIIIRQKEPGLEP